MQRWIPAILMVLLLVGFRVLGSAMPETLPNFQPLPALLLCGVIFLTGTQRWLIPMIAWVVTDPLTSLLQHRPVLGWHHLEIALGLAATVAIARRVRRSPNWLNLLGSAALAALAFYVVTNTISFVVDPLYPRTLTGFVQAQWTGPAGYGPTWLFLRNLLAANLLFTALFSLACRTLPQSFSETAPAIAR
ncbi:MAG: hypothetical protein CFE26_09825 [Verrucomicrobiales bacterium VVV1]|nr:MAG: hypothetical protein CFE26_09825 [Verrucomicrobiales bacterium VVV1]